MKRIIQGIALFLFLILLVACQNEDAVIFSDYQLEKAIRDAISQPDGDILQEDLREITELDLANKRIKSIEGLEYLDGVTKLHIQQNKIEDLSPLEGMDSLKEVNIAGNPYDADDLAALEEKEITIHTKVEVEVKGDPDGPGGYLWKVENGDTTVYLQGTIHLATEDFFPLNQKIEEAYANADIIVPEIDFNNINMFDMQATYMDFAMYPDGSTIDEHISEELYQEVATVYEELGMSMDMFATYQPWFHSTLIQQLMTEELGYIDGVDFYFLDRAEQDQKEVIGLETVEEQLSVFADTSDEFQIEMLKESLIELEEYEQQMTEMFELYKAGDADELLTYLTAEDVDPTPEEQAYMEALNDNRNYKMAEKIASFLEEDSGETYFVIVGALHLIMEPHIRSILEEEGYVIEQVL
ncbi:TraB/GumN family protein [Ornithinibacillus scapharcae]|uniref:TraB/GumN family protein n=1 Tax=Ornithinibacillus scapharcae TaxID=1147159 RepID=UPI000225BC94|nr:TraB/GumN family protein [Ornithinibacillus scapharcae]